MGDIILCTCTRGNVLHIFSFCMSEVLTLGCSWPKKTYYLIFGCFVRSNILFVFDLCYEGKVIVCLQPLLVLNSFVCLKFDICFVLQAQGQMR